jgi:hypothetical protein
MRDTKCPRSFRSRPETFPTSSFEGNKTLALYVLDCPEPGTWPWFLSNPEFVVDEIQFHFFHGVRFNGQRAVHVCIKVQRARPGLKQGWGYRRRVRG